MRPRQQSLPDPDGVFLDHDAVLEQIDAGLGGFPSEDQIFAADERVRSSLGFPLDDVAINRAALGERVA